LFYIFLSLPITLIELEFILLSLPNSIVGETGLDGFHYSTNPLTNKQQLSCSLDQQTLSFRYHMILAYNLNHPISIHAVQCFGPLLQLLSEDKHYMFVYNNVIESLQYYNDTLQSICLIFPTVQRLVRQNK
jgi:Tat protein secretion system quality control protein TatD with DNase activity